MKKILSIILVLLMVIGLCACSKEGNNENTTHEVESSTVSVVETTAVIPQRHTYCGDVKWKNTIKDIADFNLQTDVGKRLSGGQHFPAEPKTGDIYLDSDSYIYVYNMYVNEDMTYTVNESMNGWSVRRISTTGTPKFTQAILPEVAGKPVVSGRYTFYRITSSNLKNVVVPETINDITGMFKETKLYDLSVTFKGTPVNYEKCFSNSNIPGFVNGKVVQHDSEYKIYISGNCDKSILDQIAKTTEFENVVVQ